MKEVIETVEELLANYIEADKCGLSNNDFKHEIRALSSLLSDYKRALKEDEEWQNAYREAKDEQIKLIKLNQHIQKENEELKAIIAYKNEDTHRARII